MPTFDKLKKSQVTKVVYLGHSRAGKTGSLAALGAAGYNVRILDLDRKAEVLADFITNKKSIYRVARPGLWTQEQADTLQERMSYVPLDETPMKLGTSIVSKGDLWKKIGDQLMDWKDEDKSFGNIGNWTPQDVLAIDGLSALSLAAHTQARALGGRLAPNSPQDWTDIGIAQQNVKNLMKMLAADSVRCNIVLIAHIAYIETEAGPTKGFPQTIGNKLSPMISQDFSHAIMAKSSGQGDKERRVIVTQTTGTIDLGSSAPMRVKPEYPLETGLAEYFRDIRQEG